MNLIAAVVISMLPFVELRLGIPYAIAGGASPLAGFFLCTLANILVIIPIFLFLDFLHDKFMVFLPYRRTAEFFLARMRRKAKKVEKDMNILGYAALMLFVAIPLPVTGAYTGAIIAWLLNLSRRKSFFAISAGVILAGILVTLITTGVITAFSIFIG